MASILKFFGGVILTIILVAFSLARIAFEMVGASTAPDDLALLKQRLPTLTKWLFTTPWPVPTALLIVVAIVAAWLLWSATRKATEEEIESHPHLNEDKIVALIEAHALAHTGELVTMDNLKNLWSVINTLSERLVGSEAKNAEFGADLKLIAEYLKAQLDKLDAEAKKSHCERTLQTVGRAWEQCLSNPDRDTSTGGYEYDLHQIRKHSSLQIDPNSDVNLAQISGILDGMTAGKAETVKRVYISCERIRRACKQADEESDAALRAANMTLKRFPTTKLKVLD